MTALTYTGIDEIIRGFQVLPLEVAGGVRDALDPVWKDLKRALAAYPPERPGQRYRRTDDLMRGWMNAAPRYVVRGNGGIDARIENPVTYTDFVQGDAQTVVFSGRWTKAAVILTEFEQDITVAVERGCSQALQRARLGS